MQTTTMNQLTKTDTISQAIVKAKSIDAIAAGAMSLFEQAGSFEAELQLAHAMGQMRAMLTPDVMEPVMALMNTDLGFRTDKDPKQIDPKTDKPFIPYSVEVVREVFIEAKLRGFHTAGNEFNIIAGRFYGAKNGFRRKVTRFPGLSLFKDVYDVPRTVGDKGAIVKARASWTLGNVEGSIEIEIPVKVNSFMGADAILGKAERKLLKRVHDRITGQNTPEGEAGEEVDVTPAKGPEQERKERLAAPVDKPRSTSVSVDGSKSANEPAPTAAPSESTTVSLQKTPQQDLQEQLERHGVPFDDFRSWLTTTGFDKNGDSYATWGEVPLKTIESIVEAKALPKIVKILGVVK